MQVCAITRSNKHATHAHRHTRGSSSTRVPSAMLAPKTSQSDHVLWSKSPAEVVRGTSTSAPNSQSGACIRAAMDVLRRELKEPFHRTSARQADMEYVLCVCVCVRARAELTWNVYSVCVRVCVCMCVCVCVCVCVFGAFWIRIICFDFKDESRVLCTCHESHVLHAWYNTLVFPALYRPIVANNWCESDAQLKKAASHTCCTGCTP